MRKSRMISALLCAFLCSGCVNHINEEADEPENTENRRIVFKTELSVTETPVRATSDNISKLIVADYQNGVERQKIEQTSSDKGFGKVSMKLDYGNHELFFVGHSSVSSTLSYPTIVFDKITDTFSYSLSVTVDENTEATQTITLNRSVGLVKIIAEDAIPSTVSSLKVTLSNYYPALNIKKAIAEGDPKSVERTFEYKTSHIGVKGSTYSIYTFAPEGGFKTDILISSLDAKGTVIHAVEMKDVSVEKNRQTILSGNIFQTEIGSNIAINNQWGKNIEMPI